jgi:hypothetical protein
MGLAGVRIQRKATSSAIAIYAGATSHLKERLWLTCGSGCLGRQISCHVEQQVPTPKKCPDRERFADHLNNNGIFVMKRH